MAVRFGVEVGGMPNSLGTDWLDDYMGCEPNQEDPDDDAGIVF